MRAFEVGVVVLFAATSAAGQFTISNPPPMCFAFNDTGTPATMAFTPIDNVSGSLTIHFTAPVSAVIERLDLPGVWVYVGPCAGGTGYTLHATASLGGPVVGPSLSSFNNFGAGYEPLPPGTWSPWWRLETPPVTLTAGSTYALVQQFFCAGCVTAGYDTAGTTLLAYQSTGSGLTCPPGVPSTGQLPFAMRFRGTNCGPGPPASMLFTPDGCAGFGYVQLSAQLPPVLGAPWSADVLAGPGEPVHLFWAAGVNVAGTPIPGTFCQHHLDPATLQSLYQLGLQPLVSATAPPAGSATFAFAIPANPALAGLTIGLQALIITPTGWLPLGPGSMAQITNAIGLTVGY